MSENNENTELERGLSSRHLQMIAIGGAIGTGLFLGSGEAIKTAGPALILAYAITGFFTYVMMRAVGELLLSNTKLRSFIDFVRLYLGERWEFVIGWAYWLSWASLAIANLTATGIYLRYWFPGLPQWLAPLIVVFLLIGVNLINVRLFGELESGFASVKVFAIIGLIVAGLWMIATGFSTHGTTASFANLFNHGGFFATGGWGFLMAFPMVIFAFTGIEMVGLMAGETANPKEDLPKAIKSVPKLMSFFYIGSLVIIMSIYPWNQLDANQSPFVQVFAGLGIQFAADLVNFVVLTSAISAANSAIFSTSRTLYVLAKNKQAPKALTKLSKQNVPVNAMLASVVTFLLGVLLNYFYPSSVFVIITGVATISFIFVWILILITHIQYKRTIDAPVSDFKMPLFPASSYITIAFYVAILFMLMFNPTTQVSVFAAVIYFGLMAIGYSVWQRRKKNS